MAVPKKPDASVHILRSSYREMLLEHLLIGEILRHLWGQSRYAQVLKPGVSDAGYDVVIDCDSVIRHIQFKASCSSATAATVDVNLQLAKKPSGCVIWTSINQDTLAFESYRWFGGRPGERLPSITDFTIARHKKGKSTGRRAKRPNFRTLPKGAFTKTESIEDLVTLLFGTGSRPRRSRAAKPRSR